MMPFKAVSRVVGEVIANTQEVVDFEKREWGERTVEEDPCNFSVDSKSRDKSAKSINSDSSTIVVFPFAIAAAVTSPARFMTKSPSAGATRESVTGAVVVSGIATMVVGAMRLGHAVV